MNTEIDRKIAVILVADVVGYSKHMERDENATLKAYAECEKLLKACLKKYKGSIFNTAGDSALAEFPSAVNAVECGVAFQSEIKKRNQSDKTEVKLEFRIGINMGDVVKKEGNLFGDGVNIAARLEALAQPNGISISKSVYDLVVPKTKMTFNDLGVQKVKQNEFHAFDILLDPSQKRSLKTKSRSMLPIIGAVASVVFLAVGFMYFYNSGKNEKQVTTLETSSKPILLIMPIETSGLTDDQKGFARGITESMISTLSTYQAIKVLSSSTSFHAQKTEMLDNAIREDYGVDYLIRGSMQVMGNNARLNLAITDLKAAKVTLSKKKDFNMDEIFKVQDELGNEILSALSIDLGVGSAQGSFWAKRYRTMEDFTKYLNWRNEWRKFTKKGYLNSLRIFEELKASYPEEKTHVLILEAWQLYQKLNFGLSKNKEKDLKRLKYTLDRAIEIESNSVDALAARALIGIQYLGSSCEDSMADIIKTEQLGSTVDTLTIAAGVYENCGELKKGLAATRSALELVPNDFGWFITTNLVVRLYKDGQIDEIYKLIGDDILAEDMGSWVLAIYAFLEQDKGNMENAKKYLERAKKRGLNLGRFEASLKSYNEELHKKTINGLKKIGDLE
jgi:class 3 adenylate cyclase/TolB-like protein